MEKYILQPLLLCVNYSLQLQKHISAESHPYHKFSTGWYFQFLLCHNECYFCLVLLTRHAYLLL